MSWLRAVLLASLVAALAPSAHAGEILDRVRAQKVIHCGGEPRPGLVTPGESGHPFGLFLDVCRAVGAAVLGTDGRIDFNQYDSSKAYDAVRNGTDDISFLTAAEVVEENVAGKIQPGPTVFVETTSIMVPDDSPFQHVADLAGKPICFSLASSTQRQLEAWFAARHLDFMRMGYQEDVELYDTYGARVCPALASETTELGEVRLDGGVNHITSRFLPEPLAAYPVMASTPIADPEWSAIVAWAVHTLVRGDTPTVPWAAGGAASLPLDAAALHLDKDWQTRMLASTGSYGEIFKRNLGEDSPYHLARGMNASWQDGGVLVAPYDE